MSELPVTERETSGLLARAQALIDLDRPADALPLLARALGQEPRSLTAHCLQARALLALGDRAGAQRAAESGVLIDPEHEWPHRLRSIALLQGGRTREALEAAQEATRLGPEVPECLHTLARAQLRCRSLQQAHLTAVRLRTLAPDRSLAHAILGEVALAERDWPAAEGHYRQALALDPRDANSMNNLGVAVQQQGREREAIDCFHEAARLNPAGTLAQRNLEQAIMRHLAPWRLSRPGAVLLLIVALVAPLPLLLFRLGNYLFLRGRKLRALPPAVVAFYHYRRRAHTRPLRLTLAAIGGGLLLAVILIALGAF